MYRTYRFLFFGYGFLTLLTFHAAANRLTTTDRQFATAPATGITSFNSNFTSTQALAGPATNTATTNVTVTGYRGGTAVPGATMTLSGITSAAK